MLTIDGGEGGGQLLRTALSLATITETPFRIEDIRGNRPNPGLRPQHLAAVKLVADMCDAEVTGADLEAETVSFRPGRVEQTDLSVEVGTAGSITLLFDTVLPVAATTQEPFRVAATGGTNVKWAPTIEYQQYVKLPLLSSWGLQAEIDQDRTGFYPAGGGRATLETKPSSLSRIAVETRGDLERVDIYSKAAEDLEERDVAERQAETAQDQLEDAGIETERRHVVYVPTHSLGSSLLLVAVYEHSLAGFDVLGERGRTAESVAEAAVHQFQSFHEGPAPVDVYMADQILVFLAIAGGRVRLPSVTEHVESNLSLLEAFGCDIQLDRANAGPPTVTASPHPAVRGL